MAKRKRLQDEVIARHISGVPKKQIARDLGVSEYSIHAWFKHPEFVARLQSVIDLTMDKPAIVELATGPAIDTIKEIMERTAKPNEDALGRDRLRLQAAKMFVDFALKIDELTQETDSEWEADNLANMVGAYNPDQHARIVELENDLAQAQNEAIVARLSSVEVQNADS